MRHPRTDLRTLHGPDMPEGTRAILLAQAGGQIGEPRDLPAAAPRARAVAEDPLRYRGAREARP